ncbi:MAG: hypothetical protein ISS70_19210 [Phycisphaerae bacterium]|nr:hypothetical protein [Phycisphaerae bacterium]
MTIAKATSTSVNVNPERFLEWRVMFLSFRLLSQFDIFALDTRLLPVAFAPTSRQEGSHSVKLKEMFGTALKARKPEISPGPAKIAAQYDQAGQGGCCSLSNTVEFDADGGADPGIRRPIRYLAGVGVRQIRSVECNCFCVAGYHVSVLSLISTGSGLHNCAPDQKYGKLQT